MYACVCARAFVCVCVCARAYACVRVCVVHGQVNPELKPQQNLSLCISGSTFRARSLGTCGWVKLQLWARARRSRSFFSPSFLFQGSEFGNLWLEGEGEGERERGTEAGRQGESLLGLKLHRSMSPLWARASPVRSIPERERASERALAQGQGSCSLCLSVCLPAGLAAGLYVPRSHRLCKEFKGFSPSHVNHMGKFFSKKLLYYIFKLL